MIIEPAKCRRSQVGLSRALRLVACNIGMLSAPNASCSTICQQRLKRLNSASLTTKVKMNGWSPAIAGTEQCSTLTELYGVKSVKTTILKAGSLQRLSQLTAFLSRGKRCFDNRYAAASKEFPPSGLSWLKRFGHSCKNLSISVCGMVIFGPCWRPDRASSVPAKVHRTTAA